MSLRVVQNVTRLLIGIDRPTSRNDVVKYVLSNFSNEEESTINERIDAALATLFSVVEERLSLNRLELIKQIQLHDIDKFSQILPKHISTAKATMLSLQDESKDCQVESVDGSAGKSEIREYRSNDPSPER